ncbi:hypothetical protein PRIPAC_93576, partial [Pristionchus pacificus]|uniref:Uncharacterized protein n=1 Tax=Pristionchus pacificus TaxID=54126 RepID=A0A2A6CDA7_PRIPA
IGTAGFPLPLLAALPVAVPPPISTHHRPLIPYHFGHEAPPLLRLLRVLTVVGGRAAAAALRRPALLQR